MVLQCIGITAEDEDYLQISGPVPSDDAVRSKRFCLITQRVNLRWRLKRFNQPPKTLCYKADPAGCVAALVFTSLM
ncbi:hypothetical protein O9929_12655 [Vibrio lentus]|nr:hypothetical protein [Vibrio lentus]